MRVLVDCSSAAPETGGNLQLCRTMVNLFAEDGAISTAAVVNQALLGELTESARRRVVAVCGRPASSPQAYVSWIRTIRREVKSFGPDILFAPYGPLYWDFGLPTVQGFAEPWEAKRSELYLSRCSARERIWARFRRLVQTYFYARSAGLWAETRGAAEFFCGTSGYPQARTIVIPNAVADTFSMSPVGPSGWDFTNSRTFRLLYVAAPYKHKNHDIIRDIACHARKENIEFHVTLPVDHPYTARLYRMLSSDGVDKMVVNHGHVKADKLPGLYSMADAVFMPSIAEVFSATYLEGMLSQRPVVACDLPFAREILGDAGLLFDPEDVESAIACILRLRDDQEKYKELVARGIRKIEDYGSREEKYQTTVSFLRQVCERSWH